MSTEQADLLRMDTVAKLFGETALGEMARAIHARRRKY